MWKPRVDRNRKARKSPLLSLPQSCALLLRTDLRLLSLTMPGFPASGLCVWEIACPMWGLRRISREMCPGGHTGLLFPEETPFFGLEVQSPRSGSCECVLPSSCSPRLLLCRAVKQGEPATPSQTWSGAVFPRSAGSLSLDRVNNAGFTDISEGGLSPRGLPSAEFCAPNLL